MDSSFAGEGYRGYQLGAGATRINALLIQPGGHIVTAGSIDQQAALARFTGEGELDEQFAENGLKRYPQLESSALTSLTARAHGRLVAVGHSGDYAYGLVVATSDGGADDPGFNDGKPLELQAGLLPTSFRAVAVKLDDLVVIAGNTEQRAATVFRLKPDGSPDPAFAREGYIYGLDFRMTTMALQDDSNILLGGALVSGPVLKRYVGSDPVAKTAPSQ